MEPRDLTSEEEVMFDAQADEQEWDDWLAAWSADFNSHEYAEALEGGR